MISLRPDLTVVRSWLWNARLDLRHGALLAGAIPSRREGAYDVANVQYSVLPDVFDGRVRATDVIVDVGCGKGRVINWLLTHALPNRIVGLELNEEVAARTRRRLAGHQNVEIIAGDAMDNLPADGTLFFLFNPFDAAVMRRFRRRLCSVSGDLARVSILYYAPLHLDVFREDPGWVIEEREVSHQDARFQERHRRFAVIRRGPEG